ncbi:MAG: LysR family transcriptional regulator [Mesorhizobium sp.]|nr:MAG: LysR family transcriptional regulator [Mesorhizobium sp.]
MTLRRKLPSTHALFTFEAAARSGSFSAAGRELNVTQPAVSKSIAALEEHIDTKLFYRGKSGLKLTPEGETLHRAVQLSFLAVETAIDQISGRNRPDDAVMLSLSTAFAAHWLIPQMEDFRGSFPDLTLDFQLTGGEAIGPISPCDLGVRLDTNVSSGDRAAAFAPEWLIALASPEYIKRNGMLDASSLKASHLLVTLASPRIGWQEFLNRTNQSLSMLLPEMRVPDYSVVIQTALNGRGVALGYVTSCGYLLREGILVPAMHRSLRTGHQYCLAYPANSRSRRAEEVGDWIAERTRVLLADIEGLTDQAD